ncbi:hypothetical protein [Actinacidiphila oryziradicis]|uniref:Uncharacterized protein n=1 Tax=Actinacidiphila oryziradicis TaxID=2571141 RepID=A0A4U0SJC6_9ACTN|nr:hypothetical protein [Actinacidiphila oryziradicis]TKA00385.1 hypothetical protein FCI23_42920 [Actinacidiphila oryziradicis]
MAAAIWNSFRPGRMICRMRLIGGANVPAVLGPFKAGRLNATWPFGELTVEAGRIRLRVRLFGALVAGPTQWSAQEIAEVFPCRGLFGTSGVGFRVDGRNFYFWTRESPRVLDACEGDGFVVSREVQRESLRR